MKEQCFCIKFFFRSGRVHQECVKYFKQLSVTLPYGENRSLNGVLY